MKLREYITGRVVAWIIIAILGSLFASMKAHAGNYPDEGTAYARCMATAALVAKRVNSTVFKCDGPLDSGANRYYMCKSNNGPSGGGGLQSCAALGEPEGNFFYPIANACSARQDYYAGFFATNDLAGTNAQCNGGCMYSMRPDATKMKIDQPLSNSIFAGRGSMTPTGAVCVPNATNPEPDKPLRDKFCHDTRGGYTVCVDSNGRQCVTSPTSGRTYCPDANDKIDATNPPRTEAVKKSNNATDPGTPTPRPGEDWKSTDKVNTTTTTGGSSSSSSINISQNGGKPNTDPNQGNPGDGSGDNGTPSKGDGRDGGDDDDGEQGSVSGGNTCALAPSCTGDPLLCAEIEQTWFVRCEAHLRDLKETDAAAALSKEDGTEGFDITSIFSSDDDQESELDESGFGWARTCPEPPEFFDTFLDFAGLCDMFSMIGLLVVAVGALHSFYIITGGT